ncbi:MAG: hypothetical protein ACK45I_09660 [Bacteroidota bacterium]
MNWRTRILLVFIWWMSLMLIMPLIFGITNSATLMNYNATFLPVLYAFFYGFRLDLSMSSFLTILPFLLIQIERLFTNPYKSKRNLITTNKGRYRPFSKFNTEIIKPLSSKRYGIA